MFEYEPGPPRLLTSYWEGRNASVEQRVQDWYDFSVFIDSGAYAAESVGAHIDPASYATWAQRWGDKPDVVANLDVINDPEASWENQQQLESLGLHPLPAVHLGASDDVLKRYLDHGYRYIGLGGTVLRPRDLIRRWCARQFKIAQPYGAVFHGYGVGIQELIAMLPWYSVDATSWLNGSHYGVARVLDPRNGTMRTLRVVHKDGGRPGENEAKARKRGKDLLRELGPTMRRRGFDLEVFSNPDLYHHSYLSVLSADSFRRLETWARKRHGVITNPDNGGDGLRVYLAGGAVSEIRGIARGKNLPRPLDVSQSRSGITTEVSQ